MKVRREGYADLLGLTRFTPPVQPGGHAQRGLVTAPAALAWRHLLSMLEGRCRGGKGAAGGRSFSRHLRGDEQSVEGGGLFLISVCFVVMDDDSPNPRLTPTKKTMTHPLSD